MIDSNGKPAGRLVLIGSIVMDLLLYVDRLPDRGSDVLASQCHISPGGGFNLLNAARRLGMRAAYGGIIGAGRWASVIQDALAEYGIDRLAALTSKYDNGFVIGMVEPTGERTFITHPGCESMLQGEHLIEIEKRLQYNDTIYISGYEFLYPASGPLLSDWIVRASKRWSIVIDPGPLVGDFNDKTLEHIMNASSLLALNLKEAETLLNKIQKFPNTQSNPSAQSNRAASSGRSDSGPTTPARRLRTPTTPDSDDSGPIAERMASLAGMIHGYLRDGATLIVRAGEHGCVIVPGTDHTAISTEHPSAGNTPVVIPSRPAREVVDTTGAGDVHTAVYLVSIAYGIPKADAAWIANVAASMSVERKGGASCPSIGELNAYLSTNEI